MISYEMDAVGRSGRCGLYLADIPPKSASKSGAGLSGGKGGGSNSRAPVFLAWGNPLGRGGHPWMDGDNSTTWLYIRQTFACCIRMFVLLAPEQGWPVTCMDACMSMTTPQRTSGLSPWNCPMTN